MILSRIKPAVTAGSSSDHQSNSKQIPTLEEFLKRRDYTGAITVLEFDQSSGKGTEMTNCWLGYCAFHLGDYQRALSIYQALGQTKNPPEDLPSNLACCYFFLGMYPQSEKILESTETSRLKTRLMFHLAHKLGDEKKLMEHHQQLQDMIEDQLSLASIHYLRSHYQEAIDIYKRILLDNSSVSFPLHLPTHAKKFYLSEPAEADSSPSEYVEFLTALRSTKPSREYLALNVYVALCYYKLDYYDVSQEVLAVYLQKYPDSAIAINLKACNHFRLYNGKAAEAEIKTLMDQSSSSFSFGHDLIRHNIVVFRGGTAALQVLPPLVDVIPEARLNLVIYHLKQEEYKEAFLLVKDLEPSVPQEYILKGVVNVAIGQESGSREHIKVAQQFFHLVGSSASECDTIPGRQCMASSFFLQRQFDDVMLYLSSIKSYYCNDDSFNFNYAQAKAALGHFKEAEEIFLMVQNEKLQNDYVYISHLARCYVMCGKPQSAWELYLKMETSADSFSLLQVLANDCYRMGQFWHAAKAFDMLERLDPSPEYWEGKRGACAGIFQLIIAGKQAKELLPDVIQLLRNTANPQVETIIWTMKRWAKENKINV